MAGLRTRITGGLAALALALPVAAAWPGTAQAQALTAHASRAAIKLDQIVGELNGVTALSASDVWAVGDGCPGTEESCPAARSLILHRNGTAWTRSATPAPAKDFQDIAESVSADSATDAWAVGVSQDTSNGDLVRPLLLHWNGTAWAKVNGPNPGTSESVSGVYALSPTNAWAVGYECVANCTATSTGPLTTDTLILHWNGTSWSQVTSPSPGALVNELTSVSGSSSSDIWAAGEEATANSGPLSLILHWNGTTWSQVSSPNAGKAGEGWLNGIGAASPTAALGVGVYCASACGSGGQKDATMGMDWNGTAWALTTTPSPAADRPELAGVSALSATQAWAVGSYAITTKTLIAEWNGTAWSQVSSPNPSGRTNSLAGVYAITGTNAWAVGTSTSTKGGVGAEGILILHWNGKAWSVVAS
jgi:hypothetical protein